MKTKNAVQFRQGDVFLQQAAIPKDAALQTAHGRAILAYGEVTGHAHALDPADVELYEKDGVTYVRVTHARGAAIDLPREDDVETRVAGNECLNTVAVGPSPTG